MTYIDWLLGAALLLALVLALRSYFGRKYGQDCGGCSSCPHAGKCLQNKANKD